MYDKKKTIKGYMGGGYMKPMSYANGGYIPGLSSLLYGAGLNRDKEIAMREYEENAKKIAKEQKYRGLLGKLGSFAGTALGAALAAPTGGMSVLAGKALGSAIGKGAGELVGGSFVDTENLKKSSTGLYKDDFEFLRKQGREAQDLGGLAERSAIAGATTYGLGKAGEVADLGKKAYAEKFGMDALENLGLAGETDPLLSSLTKDMSTAQAGAESIIGDREKLLQDIIGGESIGFEDAYQDLFEPRNLDLELSIQRGRESFLSDELGMPLIAQKNQGGYVQGYEDGGRAKKRGIGYFDREFPKNSFQANSANNNIIIYPKLEKGSDMAKDKRGMGYFNREFPKDSFKAMIQEAVYKGELDPREGLQHILSKQQKDFMKSKDDTSNSLYKRLQGAGYSKGGKIEEYGHGGLIDMNPFSRRIL